MAELNKKGFKTKRWTPIDQRLKDFVTRHRVDDLRRYEDCDKVITREMGLGILEGTVPCPFGPFSCSV
jgi:hypothetical protein